MSRVIFLQSSFGLAAFPARMPPAAQTTTRSTSSADVIYGLALKSNKYVLLTRLICSPAAWRKGGGRYPTMLGEVLRRLLPFDTVEPQTSWIVRRNKPWMERNKKIKKQSLAGI